MKNDDLLRQEDPRDPCLAQYNSKNFGKPDGFAKNRYGRGNRRFHHDQKSPAGQVSSQSRPGALHAVCP